jgi:hypothetical protein
MSWRASGSASGDLGIARTNEATTCVCKAWFRINEPSPPVVERVDLSDQFHQAAKN